MGRMRKKYPREFKLEAVKQLQSGECSQAELARRLGVSSVDLSSWRAELEKRGGEAFPGKGNRSGAQAELDRLRRELEQVKEERDILKKAMAFFAKESR